MASYRKCCHCNKSPEYLTKQIDDLKRKLKEEEQEIKVRDCTIQKLICDKKNIVWNTNIFDFDVYLQSNKEIDNMKEVLNNGK